MRTAPTLPPGVVGIADHEARAQAQLDPASWAYLDSAAGDGITRRGNRQAWQHVQLVPRLLRPRPAPSTAIALLGRRWAHPIMLAPLAYQRLFHPDGETGTALAASAQQAGFVLSTLSSVPMEDVAGAVARDADRGPLWFQLYFQPDRAATLELVRRAEACGFEAIVVTADAPVNGVRDGERRAGFRLPAGITAANLPKRADTGAGSVAELAAIAPDWADLEWLLGHTRLPVLLKGVLHPDDALQAHRQGIAGLIVSNHGGRTLDGAPPTAQALVRVAQATGGAVPLLVDGGIRRGGDVLKAIALGATAVLVGRPLAWGLASAGPLGVAHVLRLLRDELEAAMALCGMATLDALPPDLALRTGSV
jgi:4-hydroxymandelate oxidase